MSVLSNQRITVPQILNYKKENRKIVALTAYDYTMASIIDAAGVDLILVGDSLGSIVQGHETTLPVTLDEMVYHCKAVARAVKRACLVGDLPFLSYQVSVSDAVRSAGTLIKDGNCQAVKIEGGSAVLDMVKTISSFDIPVMGHIGLTPQSVHAFGGYKIQGKDAKAAEAIFEDALRLEDSGAFSVVLECIPHELAARISERLAIPTIGIGSGTQCNGQILVVNDLLGFSLNEAPKFVQKEASIVPIINEAISRYIQRVRQ